MTISTDSRLPTAKSSSRRALLIGALGGAGAVAAGAIGRVSPVRGADGDIVYVGDEHTSSSLTGITNSSTTAAAFRGRNQAGGTGVWGRSDTSYGVYAQSDSGVGAFGISTDNTGVIGHSNASDSPGVRGYSSTGSTGVLGLSGASPSAKPKTGVYGYANQDSGSRGVWGNSGKGRGVYGQSRNGVGVYAGSTNGYALRAKGRIKADKVSGVATIAAGNTGVTVSPGVNVTSGSFVLLTPKANLGGRDLWFTTNASADTFRIRMSSSRGSNTKVAWLLLG